MGTSGVRTGAARTGWVVGGVALLAFAAFEIAKHRGWVPPLAAVGLALPLAGGIGTLAPVVRSVGPPSLVLLTFTVLPETQQDAAPGFTLGLAWLAHVCLRRALRLA